jgi:hypothetical protein
MHAGRGHPGVVWCGVVWWEKKIQAVGDTYGFKKEVEVVVFFVGPIADLSFNS